jgi:uncharacterized protein with PQ loop repeat
MHATAVLGPICTALSISFVWPQVLRIYRLDTVEGLAPNGTLQGLAACALWAMYGAAQGIGPLVVSNSVIGVAMMMIAAAQIRHGTITIAKLLVVVATIAVVGSSALAVSTTMAGWIAIVIGVTSILPQTIHVSRAADLSGVSLPMYALVVLTSVLWSTYAVLIQDWLVLITNGLIAPCALFVALKAWRAQYPQLSMAAELR